MYVATNEKNYLDIQILKKYKFKGSFDDEISKLNFKPEELFIAELQMMIHAHEFLTGCIQKTVIDMLNKVHLPCPSIDRIVFKERGRLKILKYG